VGEGVGSKVLGATEETDEGVLGRNLFQLVRYKLTV
jgi:hypothetical protein